MKEIWCPGRCIYPIHLQAMNNDIPLAMLTYLISLPCPFLLLSFPVCIVKFSDLSPSFYDKLLCSVISFFYFPTSYWPRIFFLIQNVLYSFSFKFQCFLCIQIALFDKSECSWNHPMLSFSFAGDNVFHFMLCTWVLLSPFPEHLSRGLQCFHNILEFSFNTNHLPNH